jgi:hypothetical protein
MTIGLCPLDFGDDSPPPIKKAVAGPPPTPSMKDIFPALDFGTECNYLVMFFILGVFLLALSDQMKGR